MNEADGRLIKIVVICGPTGIGKTGIAMNLAETFNGRIVSADSVQIYRHMDIGTAKASVPEQARVPHYMIDIIAPDTSFDAARYATDADKCIHNLAEKKILPIVAGGTGLYIKALIHGIFKDQSADLQVRCRLKQEAENLGGKFLFQRLEKIDPETAGRIHINDTYRIVRALETYEVTGVPLSEYHKNHRFDEKRFDAVKIGLQMDRNLLYERIERRVDLMIEAGLVDEVKNLVKMGYGPDLKSMQSIGYRQMLDYINGNMEWDEAVRILKRDTRRYAKRQFTWFRKDKEINWFEPDQISKITNLIDNFLSEDTAR
ncbi:tRNA (adenosine(37)-N6)-dimethylallyltransferase MiaA [Desulfobacterales bacterium HSG16]|nr:tRNA (adenosine(37)-N6)-dimethylallyltransferase MiaA [Desulfobacterales bacterium HSG16]